MSITDPNGRKIQYETHPLITGDGESVKIISILDPHSTSPARRITSDGETGIAVDDLAGSGTGLTVFGRFWGDRASLAEVWLRHDRPAAAAVIDDCIRRGLGYEEPLIAEAVRKRLGLSQSEIGIKMGMAPSNLDDAARRRNVGRSVRRYETDGGPPIMYGLALRWLAFRAGLIDLLPGS